MRKIYMSYEARVRRLIGRLGMLAIAVIVTFIIYALFLPLDWVRP